MKLLDHFASFLKDEVNLNQTRIDRLKGHVEAIQNFLRGSHYDTQILRFSPQGSWAHKTIIKPQSRKEFDADLVIFMNRHDEWSPKEYVNNLYHIFNSSDRYKEKVSRRTRCVVLDYAGDFHLDMVPCVVDDGFYDTTFEVCNRNKDIFEVTASEAYTSWLEGRNTWAGRNMLRHSIRVLKYLRDIKGTFSVKSILLTTLVGNCVYSSDVSHQAHLFSDLPTSLQTLIGRLDSCLQAHSEMPLVRNPVLPEETFTRHWNQAKYENFSECVHRYRGWIDDAYKETDRDESIRKWRRVFGDSFAKGEVAAKATLSESLLLNASQYTDVVTAIALKGPAFIEKILSPRLPHVEWVPWRVEDRLSVVVRATEYMERNGTHGIGPLESGRAIDKNRWIRFEVTQRNGFPLPPADFEIQWQVVNTDKEAVQADALRGDFYKSDQPGIRWESTFYRGAHWVEAFVISRRKGTCWGSSGRFFVVIQ